MSRTIDPPPTRPAVPPLPGPARAPELAWENEGGHLRLPVDAPIDADPWPEVPA